MTPDVSLREKRRRPRESNVGLWVCVVGLVVIVLVGIFAPILAPHDPLHQELSDRLLPPIPMEGATWNHPLGTDDLGRDMLSRLIFGARVSILVGVLAVVVRMVAGVTIGLVAGYFGGPVRSFFMRLGDVQMALPSLILALGIIAAIGPGFRNVVLVLGFTGWILYARLVVSQVVLIRSLDYVNSARLLGASHGRILLRHVLPNVMPSVTVYASLDVGMMMYAEASLSFIGVGVQPPTPSWGGMASAGQALLSTHWWLATLPGAALLVTLVFINLLGEQVRDRLDPRLKIR